MIPSSPAISTAAAAAAMPYQRNCCGWRMCMHQWPCPLHIQYQQAAWTTESLISSWERWGGIRLHGGARLC
jgi:hypothetical protein